MENKTDYSDDIKTIKKIMEESSRFLSLSGLSGLFTGSIAIAGGFFALFGILKSHSLSLAEAVAGLTADRIADIKLYLAADAAIILILSLATGLIFSIRKARRKSQNIWTPVSRRLLTSVSLPLITGAFFIVMLYCARQYQLIIPSMLIFYGLALINAGKFTYNELFYLGISELLTGFCAALFSDYSILLWIFGFGFLHIGYGLFMYRKYEI